MRYLQDFPGEYRVADLRRADAVYELVEGCQAVIHLGNHPNAAVGTAQRVFAENCAMNINVLQAAVETGVKKILFASSIQAVCTALDAHGRVKPPPYLPLDGHLPISCGNSYAASKAAGEILMASLASGREILAAAVRLPWVWTRQTKAWIEEKGGRHPMGQWPDGLWLHVLDAADCFEALLGCEAKGFHTVMPARTREDSGIAAESWRQQWLAGVPLQPGWQAPLPTLVDTSGLEALCGWSPARTPDDEFPG